MATVTVTISGVEAVNAKLSKLQGIEWAVRPMYQSVMLLHERMAKYPPRRPGSRYVRGQGMANSKGQVTRKTSEVLGQQWTTDVKRIGNHTVTGKVGNKASYAPWVQAKKFQAWMHRGRWQTEEQVAQEESAKIADFFRAAIERAAK